MAEGSASGLVKIRVIAANERTEDLARKFVEILKGNGFEIIEWTSPYPCRAPDTEKSRVYISAVKK